MKIQITENIKEHASLITKHKNFGNRAAGFNGNTQKQTTGIIGELIIYKVLGLPFPTYQGNCFQFIIRHPAGKKHNIMTVLEYFRE